MLQRAVSAVGGGGSSISEECLTTTANNNTPLTHTVTKNVSEFVFSSNTALTYLTITVTHGGTTTNINSTISSNDTQCANFYGSPGTDKGYTLYSGIVPYTLYAGDTITITKLNTSAFANTYSSGCSIIY